MRDATKQQGLSPRQQLFADGIIAGKSGKQAYTDAGYTALNTEVGASQLLRNPKVVAYIAEIREKSVTDAIMSRTEVLESLTMIARDKLSRSQVKALHLLGLSHGLFITKTEVTGKDGSPLSIQVYIPANGRDE